MTTEQILYFACWLLIAALGAGALVLAWGRLRARSKDRPGDEAWPAAPALPRKTWLAGATDGLAVASAASLPWSTTATGILVSLWLLAAVSALDFNELRRQVLSPAGGLPLVLVAMAALGMIWADVSVIERWHGLDGFLKLLFIPFLLARFRHSERGAWVVFAFLGACIVLLLASFGLVLTPGLSWRGKLVGVPVKDYIAQSGVFALCAFGLLGGAVDWWRSGRWRGAVALAVLAAAFVANVAYVEASRTTLVTSAVIVLLFGFRSFGWKGMLGAAVVGAMLAGTFWMSSSYLRGRVMHVFEEVQEYRDERAATSSGLRLDFWSHSVEAVVAAPVIGHGTGSIPEMLSPAGAGDTTFGTVNPHNQIFVVAIQLGLLGTAVLLAMWLAHLLLFRGTGLVNWFGTISVVQLIGSSLFNSHLSDFTQGWIYVFAVGVLGGMVLGGRRWPGEGARSDELGPGVAQVGKDR